MTEERLELAVNLQRQIREVKALIYCLGNDYLVSHGDHKVNLLQPDSMTVHYYGGQGFSIYNKKYFRVEFVSIEVLEKELSELEDQFIKA